MSAALLLLLVAARAQALDGNDRLELTLTTGEVVAGWYYDLRGERILLSGNDRIVEVPTPLLAQVAMNGEPVTLEAFGFELDQVRATKAAWLASAPPHPPGGVVVGMSVLWAGAGHAALGEWKQFAAYSAVEAVFLGVAAYNLAEGSDLSVLVPIAGLDILFKAYSAGEARSIARRRRAALGLRPDDRAARLRQGVDAE